MNIENGLKFTRLSLIKDGTSYHSTTVSNGTNLKLCEMSNKKPDSAAKHCHSYEHNMIGLCEHSLHVMTASPEGVC